MLVIRASDDVPSCEIDFLTPLGQMLDFDVDKVVDLRRDKVATELASLSVETYDYLYLCGHGDKFALGGQMMGEPVAASWPHISDAVCQALRPDSVVVLGCCDGALLTVAYDFLEACDDMRHIFGLAGSVLAEDLMLALHTVLSGVSGQSVDGHTAAERASRAIGRRVSHFDGDDLRYSVDFSNYLLHEQATKYRALENPGDFLDQDDLLHSMLADWSAADING